MTVPRTDPAAERGRPRHRPVILVARQTPRPVKVLVAGVFVNRVGSFFSTFATLFLAARGFSGNALAGALVAIAVAGMLGSWGGGRLAERFGNSRLIVASMVASSAALVLLALARGMVQVALVASLVAVAAQAYVPAASTLLAEHSAPEDRVPVFAFFRLALNLGSALGPLLAGLLALQSYTLLFLLDAATCGLCAVVLHWGARSAGAGPRPSMAEPPVPGADLPVTVPVPVPVPAPVPVRVPDSSGPVSVSVAVAAPVRDRDVGAGSGAGDGEGSQERWRTRRVRLLCVLLFAVAAVYVQHQSTLPLQLAAAGLPPTFYGVLLSINGFVVLAGEIPVSTVTRRLPWRIPLAVGVTVMAAGLSLAGLLGPRGAVVAAFVLFTIGEMIFAPVANAAVADLAPPARLARYQGWLATAQGAGFTVGPVVGVALWNSIGRALWPVTGVFALALALGILWVGMRRT